MFFVAHDLKQMPHNDPPPPPPLLLLEFLKFCESYFHHGGNHFTHAPPMWLITLWLIWELD